MNHPDDLDAETCIECGDPILPIGTEEWVTLDGRMFAIHAEDCS